MSEAQETKAYLMDVGGYMMWDVDDERFGITNVETGESGVYQKQEFLPYIEAFFGLNF